MDFPFANLFFMHNTSIDLLSKSHCCYTLGFKDALPIANIGPIRVVSGKLAFHYTGQCQYASISRIMNWNNDSVFNRRH